jgi:hypothetical protein
MPTQPWTQVLDGNFDIANGTTNTSGAEAIIMPDKTIPAFYMVEGRALRLSCRFKYSNAVTTPGSITFRIRWGGVAGTLLAQSSAIPLNIVAQTDLMGFMRADIVCRARGSSGSLLCMGSVEIAAQLAANNNATAFMGSAGGASTNTPAAVTATTIVDTLLSITYQSTVATGSMTGMIYVLELLN